MFWEDQASSPPDSFSQSVSQSVIVDHLLYVSSAVSGAVIVGEKFPHEFISYISYHVIPYGSKTYVLKQSKVIE